MSVELKIKSKHLALEPAIIRKEERKLQKRMKWYAQYHQLQAPIEDKTYDALFLKRNSLASHRTWDVRNEARATYLARAYIKGIPYRSVENKSQFNDTLKRIVLPRVFDMVAKYGKPKIRKHWIDGKYDYKPDQKELLMSEIKLWFGIE